MAAPRITGKLAALFLSPESGINPTDFTTAVRVADIFDWTLESTAESFECSVKNESYDRFESGGANARLTAQRYLLSVTTYAGPQQLNSRVLTAVRVGATAGNRLAWMVVPIATAAENAGIGTGGSGKYAFGFGWVVRGSLTAPRGMMVDSLEIQVDGEWQYGNTP